MLVPASNPTFVFPGWETVTSTKQLLLRTPFRLADEFGEARKKKKTHTTVGQPSCFNLPPPRRQNSGWKA